MGGPNGSGKSTLISHLLEQGIELGEYINADDIVNDLGLIGDTGAREGQLLADAARERCLKSGNDFSFETVMSHVSKIEFMARAQSLGYLVTLFFVATADPELNVERVWSRVAQGGHDVPADRIIARYKRAMALMPQAVAACNSATIFDNSRNAAHGQGGLRPVLRAVTGDALLSLQFLPPVPTWVLNALDFSETVWCFHKIFTDGSGSINAHLIRQEDVVIKINHGLRAPVDDLKAALERPHLGTVVIHDYK